MKSINLDRAFKLFLSLTISTFMLLGSTGVVFAQSSEYPSSTSGSDKNITVNKTDKWIEGFDGQIKITASGIDRFELKSLPSDVVFVLDNSNSMYTPECYNKNHVVYLPYESSKIKDGAFAEKSKVTGFMDSDILSQDTWDEVVIPGLYQQMEGSFLWEAVKDKAEKMTKKEAVNTYGPDLLGGGYKFELAGTGGLYIKLKAGAKATDKIGTNPASWTMYDSSNALYTKGGIINGVIYAENEVIKPIEGNSVIDENMWENTILPQIKAGFTPGMVIKLTDNQSLIYTGKVNTTDTSYAANKSNAENMLNWKIVDTANAHTADYLSVPEIADDLGEVFKWIDYAVSYHFDVSGSEPVRIGEVTSDGSFQRVAAHADKDGCTVRATVLKSNIKKLASELLDAGTGNRVSIVAFEDKIYESMDFTADMTAVDSFMDSMCAGPKTSAIYNTNYEAAWDGASKKLDSARKDAARFVIFITDGWPTAAGIGDKAHQNTNQNPNTLKALVNGADGIKAKYNAVVSTIGMGIDDLNYNRFVSGLATDTSLEYRLKGDDTIVTSLHEAMKETYKDIYLWARNVCITDTIDYHFSLTDKNAFLEKYPQATVTEVIKDGKTYTDIYVPIGDIKLSQTASVTIPITLKEEYRDVKDITYIKTNDGLTTEYIDPEDNKNKTIKNEDPYLPVSPKTGSIVIKADKTLKGKSLQENQFEFELADKDGVISSAKNEADGLITFPKITYNKEGSYTYTIFEKKGSEAGIKYDNAVYKVKVTVAEGLGGALKVSADTDDITFCNTYTGKTPAGGGTVDKPDNNPGNHSGNDSAVKTGDNGISIIWIILMIAAAIVIAIVIFCTYRKRR